MYHGGEKGRKGGGGGGGGGRGGGGGQEGMAVWGVAPVIISFQM